MAGALAQAADGSALTLHACQLFSELMHGCGHVLDISDDVWEEVVGSLRHASRSERSAALREATAQALALFQQPFEEGEPDAAVGRCLRPHAAHACRPAGFVLQTPVPYSNTSCRADRPTVLSASCRFQRARP